MTSRNCHRVTDGLPPIPGHCPRCDAAIHAATPRDPSTCYRHGNRMPVFADEMVTSLDSEETRYSAEQFDWLPMDEQDPPCEFDREDDDRGY